MRDQILEAAGSPRELEALYRGNPGGFTRAFPEALMAMPESTSLLVWQERLFFENAASPEGLVSKWQTSDLWLTVILSFIAGTLAKLPMWFPALGTEKFYDRNLAGIVAGALVAWFSVQRSSRKGIVPLVILGAAVAGLNFLPDNPKSASVFLAVIHAPFFFWSLVGLSFLGGDWRNLSRRIDYLRYNGELLVYTTVILIGGMVLTTLTLGLFGIIDVKIEDWYGRNVVVYGAIASPLVATFLVEKVVGNRFRIAPLLAKVFTPLFLLTGLAYLAAMVCNHKSLLTNREFLLAFNVLLLVVLGICVFSISERGIKDSIGVLDWMNAGLVAVTLAIDAVALSAILFRVGSDGFTPNRLAVLGANLLVFIHLAGILSHYFRFLREKSGFQNLENWVAAYLPAYTVWSLIVMVGFPIIFRLS